MEAPKYMFGSLMRSGFLSLHNSSIVFTIELNWVYNARDNPEFSNKVLDPNYVF